MPCIVIQLCNFPLLECLHKRAIQKLNVQTVFLMINQWGSKLVEDAKNRIQCSFEKCLFRWFMFHNRHCCYVIMTTDMNSWVWVQWKLTSAYPLLTCNKLHIFLWKIMCWILRQCDVFCKGLSHNKHIT